jgi:hypothetical protein
MGRIFASLRPVPRPLFGFHSFERRDRALEVLTLERR